MKNYENCLQEIQFDSSRTFRNEDISLQRHFALIDTREGKPPCSLRSPTPPFFQNNFFNAINIIFYLIQI